MDDYSGATNRFAVGSGCWHLGNQGQYQGMQVQKEIKPKYVYYNAWNDVKSLGKTIIINAKLKCEGENYVKLFYC